MSTASPVMPLGSAASAGPLARMVSSICSRSPQQFFLQTRGPLLSRGILPRTPSPGRRRSFLMNSPLSRFYASTQQRLHPVIRWILLPLIVVAACFFVRESFTVSVMGVQQQFPFGLALVLVGFFLGLGPGFVTLFMAGISVSLWGTTPGQHYPLAVLANMSLGVPVIFISSWIRSLLNNERIQRQALSDFVAIIAHEVRTPLSTITLAAENSINYFNNYLAEESARNIILASGRIESVISKAIDADVSEITKFTASHEEISLRPFLENLIALTSHPDRIRLDCPLSPIITTDPYLFGTAISNVLDNAIKYALNDTDISLIAREDSRYTRRHSDRL